jgi:hypothetical protein
MPARHSTRSADQVTIIAGVEAKPGWSLVGADGNDWSWAYVVHRDIPDLPGYRAGTDGSIWTCRKHGGRSKNRLTDQWRRRIGWPINKYGYLMISVRLNGKSTSILFHRLILLTFLGPCPPGKEACHSPDNDPSNCWLWNLRWGTHKSNIEDSMRLGTRAAGERNGNSRYSEAFVMETIRLRREGMPIRAIARELRSNQQTIQRIVKGQSWRHVLPHETRPDDCPEGNTKSLQSDEVPVQIA